MLYIAGQVPVQDGKRLTGRCPDEVSVEDAQRAARVCALNLLAQMEAAAGLANVEQVAQLTGFVLSTPEFGDQPSQRVCRYPVVFDDEDTPRGVCWSAHRNDAFSGSQSSRATSHRLVG